jgi:hypothetical protein
MEFKVGLISFASTVIALLAMNIFIMIFSSTHPGFDFQLFVISLFLGIGVGGVSGIIATIYKDKIIENNRK